MRGVKKYWSILKISLQNHFAYFNNLLLGTAFFVFILLVMTQLWQAIYTGQELIEGFNFQMIIWYLIITESIVLSRSNFHQEINELIKSGEMAYLLIRPYNFLAYYLFNSLGETIPKLLAHLLVGLPLGYFLTGSIELDSYFPLVLLLIFLGILINLAFYLLLALMAFWTEDNTAFFFIYSKLIFFLGGMMIPIDFFPEWVQQLSKVLPFVFVSYWPARLAVDFDWLSYGQIFFLQLGYLLIILFLTALVYRKGVQKVNVNGG